ncbi:Uncharacterised protein [Serratia proteamaculans]|nr:Uncharacterised protein [Serratia proteamaculans]
MNMIGNNIHCIKYYEFPLRFYLLSNVKKSGIHFLMKLLNERNFSHKCVNQAWWGYFMVG